MTLFAMGGGVQEYTINSIKKTLFNPAINEVISAPEWSDADLDWADPENLNKKRPMYASKGWAWHNNKKEIIQGELWGGSLEILDLHLLVKKYLPNFDQFDDMILFTETSEEMPTDGFVYRFFAALAKIRGYKKIQSHSGGLLKSTILW